MQSVLLHLCIGAVGTFHQSVFNLYPFQLIYHRRAEKPQEKGSPTAVNQIHRKARYTGGKNHLSRDASLPHNDRAGVHNTAVDDKGCQETEDAKRKPCFSQKSFFKKYAGKKADDAEGEHLPRRPRPLPEEKV